MGNSHSDRNEVFSKHGKKCQLCSIEIVLTRIMREFRACEARACKSCFTADDDFAHSCAMKIPCTDSMLVERFNKHYLAIRHRLTDMELKFFIQYYDTPEPMAEFLADYAAFVNANPGEFMKDYSKRFCQVHYK